MKKTLSLLARTICLSSLYLTILAEVSWSDDRPIIDDYFDRVSKNDFVSIKAAERSLQSAIDSQMTDGLERIESVRYLVSSWFDGKKVEATNESITRVLCKIAPFTTGQDAQDKKLRNLLLARFQENMSKKQYSFARAADCAMNNLEGGYFTYSRMQADLLHNKDCSEARLPKKESFDLLAESGQKASQIMNEFEGSYYTLRLDQRLALVNAGQATTLLRNNGSLEEAQRLFAVASKRIAKWNNPKVLARTRNGWRLYSDVFAVTHFYAALAEGGNGKSLDALRDEGINWRPVLAQASLLDAIESGIVNKIRTEDDNYLDPVYIDRILPGAAEDGELECKRWRKQAFNPREFSNVAVQCLQDYPVTDFDSLQALDTCMNFLTSSDWWVQLGAFPETSVARQVMSELEKALQERATDKGIPAELFSLKLVPPGGDSNLYRIRTAGALSRPEVLTISDLVSDVFPNQNKLVGRQKQF